MSFVKNAPEIAEEILLKAASLPEGLRSFSRTLLEKQAIDTREKLQLPPRMSLADLQKMAHAKEVDLPKVAAAKSDDFADVAIQLRKVAERRDEDLSQEIFQDAAALVAAKYEKEAAVHLPPGNPSIGEAIHAWIRPRSTTGLAVRKYKSELAAGIVGSPEHTAAGVASKAKADVKAQEASDKRSHKSVGAAIKSLPAIATGGAAAVVGAKSLTEKDKSTTVIADKSYGAGR